MSVGSGHSEELVEETREGLVREPRPVVLNNQLQGIPVDARANPHGRPRRGVPGGIAEEVDQHLLQEYMVELDQGLIVGQGDGNCVVREFVTGLPRGGLDQVVDVHPVKPGLQEA